MQDHRAGKRNSSVLLECYMAGGKMAGDETRMGGRLSIMKGFISDVQGFGL